MPAQQFSKFERHKLRKASRKSNTLIPKDVQDLMSYPFFSLSKKPRQTPIIYQNGPIFIRVQPLSDAGIATIWDADILIWAISKIVFAYNAGQPKPLVLTSSLREILSFIGRGCCGKDYHLIRAALRRLEHTQITTTLRVLSHERMVSFRWINSWRELFSESGKTLGVELHLSDWFYRSIGSKIYVLTIDPIYFDLTGGLERWLYRIVRKHGGAQRFGWYFEFRHLYLKSGSQSAFRRFASELRQIVAKQSLPGIELSILLDMRGSELLSFKFSSCEQLKQTFGILRTHDIGILGTPTTGYHVRKSLLSLCKKADHASLNLESNLESNFIAARLVENADQKSKRDGAGIHAFEQRDIPRNWSKNNNNSADHCALPQPNLFSLGEISSDFKAFDKGGDIHARIQCDGALRDSTARIALCKRVRS